MDSAPTKANGAADERSRLVTAPDSIESLQETIAAAHQRLQQRLMEEIEQQRDEAVRLRQEVERAKHEAETILARASEAAARLTDDAKREADRVVAAAGEEAARKLAQAHDTASAMLGRLRDQAGSLFATAAEEMESVQLAIVAIQNARKPDQGPVGKAASDSGTGESVVTRLVVRPSFDAAHREMIGERFDSVPGVEGVKLGEAGDESFDMLLIHGRDANVADNLIALDPEAIRLVSHRPGAIELEVTNLDWLEATAGRRP
jgi:dsDNA-specific endonuclease/ATPase MutS2